MAVGLSGLASGVDTNAVVEQLMALERQKVTRHGFRQRSITAEQNALRDVQAKTGALRTAAHALKGGSIWNDVQRVTSSDRAKVAVTRADGSIPSTTVSIGVS